MSSPSSSVGASTEITPESCYAGVLGATHCVGGIDGQDLACTIQSKSMRRATRHCFTVAL